MDRVLGGLLFIIVYLDDIFVASPSHQEYEYHLCQVLTRLQDDGLVLNLEKWAFFQQRVDFLGIRIMVGGSAGKWSHFPAR